mmetsp:Transcript_37405/g.96744  ORF Transcript_37405/g.96744 Transcript_37405/m.96744 type:complete len:566 (-) Transcript_37405:572-2269(-)
MQVAAALLDVPREDLRRAVLAGGIGALAALLRDLELVLVGVQVGDLARVQDGAHLLQEGLPGDLRVREQEDHVLVGAARLHQHPLHVVVPLVQAVALRHLDLEELEASHVCGQRGRRLAAAASDAHEQGVAKRQLKHADHAADMLDERHEQDQLHADLADGIVVLQALVDLGGELFVVRHLHVARRLGVHEVDEDDGLQLHGLIVRLLEVTVHLALAQVEEPLHVLLGDETVLEDALTLMQPDLAEILDLRQRLARALADALEDLGNIAHVEGIVRLGGRRKHFLQHGGVHLQGGRHSSGRVAGDIAGHRRQELGHHGGEDAVQALLVERVHEDQVEVARVAVSDVILAATRRAHRSQHADVNEVAELPALAIVPAVAEGRQDEHLTQDLDRRLGPILLLERHVEVINEDQHLFARRWAKGALLPLVELAVDDILRLVRGRLCRECERDGAVPIWAEAAQEGSINGCCLGGARRATDKDVVATIDERANQELVAAGVRRRHHNRVVRGVLWDVEALDAVSPWLPLATISSIKVKVVDQALAWRGWKGAPTGQVHLAKVRHEVELL